MEDRSPHGIISSSHPLAQSKVKLGSLKHNIGTHSDLCKQGESITRILPSLSIPGQKLQ